MKQLFTTILLIWALASHAQTWCPPGAQWTYNYWNWGEGYEKINYEKDTVVQQQPCKKLTGIIFACYYLQTTCHLDTSITYPYYTYESGDTVYFYYGQQFRPVYFFGSQVGDTLYYANPVYYKYGGGMCDSVIYLRVDSTGKCLINNDSLRFYITRQIGLSNPYYGRHLCFEKVGSLLLGLLPDYECYTDGESLSPRCYLDNNFATYQIDTTVDCNYIYTGTVDISSGRFTLQPNLAQNSLQITSADDISSVSILNLQGQTLMLQTCQSNTTTIDISRLPADMYILLVTDRSSEIRAKRFVKQ